jgi:hypothetical protein
VLPIGTILKHIEYNKKAELGTGISFLKGE